MRRAALLFLLAGCAPAKPAPPITVATTPGDASVSTPSTEDASAPATPVSSENEKCSPTPCRLAEKATDITASGDEVYFIRTFGLKGSHQLVKRGVSDSQETVLAMDVRPTRTARVRRIAVDKDAVFLATSEGIATWDKSNVVTLIGQTSAGAEQLAVDDTSVYFLSSDCTLRRVAKAGGAVEELVKSMNGQYCGAPHVMLDDSNVFFTADEAIFALPKSPKARSKPVKRLVLGKMEQRSVMGMTIDADNVYALLGPSGSSSKGKLVRISKKGGAPTEIAKPEPVNNQYALGSDANRIYWLETAQPKVLLFAMTKPSGEKKLIGEAAGTGYGLAVGKENVFFVTWEMTGPGSAPKVWRVTK